MRIDPEFRALIAPLAPEEREQLEANLVEHGCRDPLVVWRGVLIDGHNRYEICERLKIKYRTVEVALPSREHVLLWIEENQLGRRNLTDDQRAEVADSAAERREEIRRKEQLAAARAQRGKAKPSVADTVSATEARDRSKDTRVAIAKAARVPQRKVRAIREIKKKLKDSPALPEVLKEIRAGEKTIQQARSEIRRAERLEKVAALATPEAAADDDARRFPVLYVDPPWQYEYAETEARAIENQYPTMDLDAICKLEIGGRRIQDIATDDAVLFLWATNPKLPEALKVLGAWGFEYRTNLVWVKDKIGMGYYARQQHELLLIAKRGNLPVPEPSSRPASVICSPRGEHSAKPVELYEVIERMYPTLPKVELFARRRRDGWEAWGNQSGDSRL